MNLKIITSRVLLCFPLLFTNAYAEEQKDLFAVTPENCGKMTLEKCKKMMAWAKKEIEETRQRTQKRKENIARMHEEALGILAENQKKAE